MSNKREEIALRLWLERQNPAAQSRLRLAADALPFWLRRKFCNYLIKTWMGANSAYYSSSLVTFTIAELWIRVSAACRRFSR